MLTDRLQSVRERIANACQRAGRPPSSVTLIAVTKGVPIQAIEEALTLGLSDIGENRVQEAHEKHAVLAARPQPVRWHLIGHLQRNKARQAVELFDAIHSVDSVELIEELARRASDRTRPLDVLIQVNISGEATKSGCQPTEAAALAAAMKKAAPLTLTGLMTMPPFSDNPEASRPFFRQLRELRDQLNSQLKLSMGMSQDFEVAIEEGADFVRVGTAIFGARTAGPP